MPWQGYFHKICVSDVFIYMDTVKYSRGLINKNIIKDKYKEILITVPIFKEDKEKVINEVRIKNSEKQKNWNANHLSSIFYAYKNSKYFNDIFPEINKILELKYVYLNELCWELIMFFVKYLKIETQIIKMSDEKFYGKKSDLVLSHALKTNSQIVFLGENGIDYVDETVFLEKKILPIYQNFKCNHYKQMSDIFTEKCSIIDLIMNEGDNSKEILTNKNVTKNDLIKIYKKRFKNYD